MDNRTWVYLEYQSGSLAPGWYHATPAQADAIRQVNEAIRHLIDVMGNIEFIKITMLNGETHYYPRRRVHLT